MGKIVKVKLEGKEELFDTDILEVYMRVMTEANPKLGLGFKVLLNYFQNTEEDEIIDLDEWVERMKNYGDIH